MSEAQGHIVIIGAGHAGGTAAALLRQFGHAGPITLIGDEAVAPYQRPPLSKAWLKGEADADSLLLRPESFYAEHGITLRLGERVDRIEPDTKRIVLGDETIAYDFLILATGARPRALPLPGVDLAGVLALRTTADAEALKKALGPGKRIAVIGGGYIGLEVAASARALGAEAIVIEREARVLARVAGEALSRFFQDYHRARGVQFELSAGVEGLVGQDGRVVGIRLTDGREIACDVALIGVGAQPNDELARVAGLSCAVGITVDLAARTSDPAIFAVGDVAWRPLPLYDRMFRLESVPNALEQAKQAAAAITGRLPPTPEVPWFWSDQYDVKLQIAGVPFDVDWVILRGDPATTKFAVFHVQGDRIRAVEAVNSPAEFMAGRQLIGSGKPVDPEKLADPAVSMKQVTA